MAKKKTVALRVHTLAKELGVSSKDIIAKCVAEDIPDITNHMSAVSVGLSHTVREWFGNAEGESSTAVETAAKVDVVKAPSQGAEDDQEGRGRREGRIGGSGRRGGRGRAACGAPGRCRAAVSTLSGDTGGRGGPPVEYARHSE